MSVVSLKVIQCLKSFVAYFNAISTLPKIIQRDLGESTAPPMGNPESAPVFMCMTKICDGYSNCYDRNGCWRFNKREKHFFMSFSTLNCSAFLPYFWKSYFAGFSFSTGTTGHGSHVLGRNPFYIRELENVNAKTKKTAADLHRQILNLRPPNRPNFYNI